MDRRKDQSIYISPFLALVLTLGRTRSAGHTRRHGVGVGVNDNGQGGGGNHRLHR